MGESINQTINQLKTEINELNELVSALESNAKISLQHQLNIQATLLLIASGLSANEKTNILIIADALEKHTPKNDMEANEAYQYAFEQVRKLFPQ